MIWLLVRVPMPVHFYLMYLEMIMEVLLKMGKFTGITSELGLPADKANYISIAKKAPVTAQVIISTVGGINKLIAAKKLGASHSKSLVFDEADHMLLAEVVWNRVT